MIKLCGLASLYDGEDLLLFKRCIQSLKQQTLKIDIYLIVDGPIRMELQEIIKENNDLFKKIFYLNENVGLATALNFGIDNLDNQYTHVVRFDTDDYNEINRFKMIYDNLLEETDLFCSSMQEYVIATKKYKYRKAKNNITINKLRFFNFIFHPTVVFKLSTMRMLGGYEIVPGFEDWATWIKFMKANKTYQAMEQPLVQFSVSSKFISRRYGTNYLRKEFEFYKYRRLQKIFPIYIDVIFILLRLFKFILGRRFTKKIFSWR